MLEEFKKFIVRGNVVDLAVGVIIGVAFGAIVTSLVSDIIMPIIGAITGGLAVLGRVQDCSKRLVLKGRLFDAADKAFHRVIILLRPQPTRTQRTRK